MRRRIAFKTQVTVMGRRSAVRFDFLNLIRCEAESRCADNVIDLLRIARRWFSPREDVEFVTPQSVSVQQALLLFRMQMSSRPLAA